jgi:hypothetical protein
MVLLRQTKQARRIRATTQYREKGRFAKKPQQQPKIEYYAGNNIPEYTTDNEGNREKITYRAVVTLNGVPIHSDKKRGRPRYKNFSWAKVDYYENIDIDKMKINLLQEIANHFHCKIEDLWFYDGYGETYFDIEMPKPYRSHIYEGLEIGEY